MSKKDNRFEIRETYSNGLAKSFEVIVDKETGVNYLMVNTGYGAGLTPLLDRQGKPVVSSRDICAFKDEYDVLRKEGVTMRQIQKVQILALIILVITLLIAGFHMLIIPLSDWIVRITGIVMLVSVAVCAYSTVRVSQIKKK